MASAKTKIPGWGSDLNLRSPIHGTGAHWDEPDQQIPTVKILVSPEHKGLTPVFGTSCPLKGLSGKLRELAFHFSEGKKTHWMILLLADRVDVVEGALEEHRAELLLLLGVGAGAYLVRRRRMSGKAA